MCQELLLLLLLHLNIRNNLRNPDVSFLPKANKHKHQALEVSVTALLVSISPLSKLANSPPLDCVLVPERI